jgi:hypothetical protein
MFIVCQQCQCGRSHVLSTEYSFAITCEVLAVALLLLQQMHYVVSLSPLKSSDKRYRDKSYFMT